MEIINYECKFCKKNFKKENYLAKHQKSAKYCIIIQKKIAEEEVDKTIKNLQNVKEGIKDEIQELINITGDLIENNSVNLEKKKVDEIHAKYLEFENDKMLIENEYNIHLSDLLDKDNIKNNIEEYYDIEKIKIDKIQELYSIFEKEKNEIKNKYDNIILEEKLYEEEEKYKNKKNEWKDNLKNNKIKELENSFEIIKNRMIDLIDTITDIEDANAIEIFNNKIFKIDELLELDTHNNEINIDVKDENIEKIDKEDGNLDIVVNNVENTNILCEKSSDSKEFSSDIDSDISANTNKNNKKKQRIKRENEVIENKLLYHLILLLQDQKINNDTLLYIIIELMKHMNNYQIKGEHKKSSILFILRNFVNTNGDDINNIQDIKLFIDKYLEEFINIVSALTDKKILIKPKKTCFFPICF